MNISELRQENLAIRRHNLRKRWQDAAAFEQRSHQVVDGVSVIGAPETEIVDSQTHLEPLQEKNVKSTHREPSQTEKGLYFFLFFFQSSDFLHSCE
jgi:hypothetical protein